MKLQGRSKFCLLLVLNALTLHLLATRLFAAESTTRELRDGYFLLSDVCHDESQVNMITWVKTTPPHLVDYVDRISKLATEDLTTIDQFEKDDPALKRETNPLPPFDQAVRSSMSAEKEHDLLFGTKGPSFARALILTQLDASNYIANIAKVLADEDPSPERTRRLERMASRWLIIRQQGIEFLSAK